jgi:D-amino-acid oxidase
MTQGLTTPPCRLQTQALSKGIKLIRRHYTSITSLLTDLPSTNLLINATGIGSLHLTDILDKNLYPTRGQTLLVAEPKTPIPRMYEYERLNKYEAHLLCFFQKKKSPPLISPMLEKKLTSIC